MLCSLKPICSGALFRSLVLCTSRRNTAFAHFVGCRPFQAAEPSPWRAPRTRWVGRSSGPCPCLRFNLARSRPRRAEWPKRTVRSREMKSNGHGHGLELQPSQQARDVCSGNAHTAQKYGQSGEQAKGCWAEGSTRQACGREACEERQTKRRRKARRRGARQATRGGSSTFLRQTKRAAKGGDG